VGDSLLRWPAHGELRALDWSNIDLAAGIIRVEHSWDRIEGLVEPKSKKSKRTVPIPSILRGYLVEHRERRFALGQRTGFVFGASAESPFNYDVTYGRYGFGRRPGSSRSACTSADTPTSR
jgi:integrase